MTINLSHLWSHINKDMGDLAWFFFYTVLFKLIYLVTQEFNKQMNGKRNINGGKKVDGW